VLKNSPQDNLLRCEPDDLFWVAKNADEALAMCVSNKKEAHGESNGIPSVLPITILFGLNLGRLIFGTLLRNVDRIMGGF
jgi:hypothetical protein